MDNKTWFSARQKQLLKLLRQDNQQYLKYIFGVKHSFPLVKITPNSLHFWTGEMKNGLPILQAHIFGYEACAKYLVPAIEKQEIAVNKYFREIVDNPYKSFLHFANIERQKHLPQIYLDSSTFYASAGDGAIRAEDASFATCRGLATGNGENGTETTTSTSIPAALSWKDDGGADYNIYRGFFPFITSGLGAGATVTAATFSVYVETIKDEENDANSYVAPIQTTQPSMTALAAGDYDLVGTTKGASDVDITGVSLNAFLDFALNATGLTWIDVTGNTKLGIREGHDIDNVAPDQANGKSGLEIVRLSEYADITSDPKLVVTYTPVATVSTGVIQSGMVGFVEF